MLEPALGLMGIEILTSFGRVYGDAKGGIGHTLIPQGALALLKFLVHVHHGLIYPLAFSLFHSSTSLLSLSALHDACERGGRRGRLFIFPFSFFSPPLHISSFLHY